MRHPFRSFRTMLPAARRRTPWTPATTELSGLPAPSTRSVGPARSGAARDPASSTHGTGTSTRGSAHSTPDATGVVSTGAAATDRPSAADLPPACPLCRANAGFLIDIEGTAYRVLEDARDVQLLTDLTPEDLEEIGRAECNACGKKVDAVSVLGPLVAELRAPQRVTIGTGTTRNRLHLAGKAALRLSDRGRSLPACPECGATHDFVLDLDGFAYMVLEDDDDTELLDQSGAGNLLCSRCSAVFEL